MALLHWKDEYSVGIAAVDHEHRELIALINRLHDAFLAQGVASTEGFFGDLYKGISAHFALEERLMRDAGYDQLAAHKQDHERLLDEIRDIMDDAAGQLRAAELPARLDAWFSRHFQTHDARLHRSLSGARH